MIKKELLIQAIRNDSSLFSKQRTLLEIMILLSTDNITKVTLSELAEITKFNITSVYHHTRKLTKAGFIVRLNPESKKGIQEFEFNDEQLQLIIEHYEKKETAKRTISN